MTSYGPPLRFKAVEIATGEESDSTVSHIYHATGTFETVFEFGCSEKYKLFQSTGHTDANGVEVFFGDVVIHKNESDRIEIMSVHHSIYDGVILKDLNDNFSRMLRRSYEITRIIGNIHVPESELQRRAEEVRGENR